MKKNLVLNPIKKKFKKNKINIYLGKWYYKGYLNNDYKVISSKSNNLAFNNYKKDFFYLKKKYNEKIKDFKKFLNKKHNLNESTQFWEIIIGPFIYRSLVILWDKWSSLNYCLANERIDELNISNYNYRNFITSEYYELVINNSDKYFHDFLYSEALKVLLKKKSKNKIKVNFYKINNVFMKKLKFKKINFFLKVFNSIYCKIISRQKFFCYRSYFTAKFNIFFNFKLLNLPCHIFEFEQTIKENKNFSDTRSIPVNFKITNDFDRYYNEIILKILPMSYLENFEHIRNLTNKIQIKPKIIFTASAHKSNDNFKIWAAGKLNLGSKLIVSDHGGNPEEIKDFFTNRIYNKYLKWEKSNNKKIVQLPPNLFLKREKVKKIASDKILILLTYTDLYKCNFFDRNENDFEDYVKLRRFVNSFEKKKRDKFYFKIHPASPMKKVIIENIKKDFGNKIEVCKFEEIFNKYSLIIDTNLQTTFYQCQNSGVPVLLYYNKSFFKLNPHVKKLITKMKKNKIIFDDLKKCKKHLENIEKKPYSWWNSNSIKQIRFDFKKNCSLETKNNLDYWVKYFKKL